MLKHVNQNDFEQEVLKNSKLTLVDFYADWCGPCQMVGPVLEKLSKEETNFDIVKLNVDENSDLARQYGVMSIPTLILFKEGKPVDGVMGYVPEKTIKELVNKNLN